MKTRWNSVEGVPRRCVARSNGWQKKNKTTKNKKNKKNKKKEKNNKTICVSRTPSPTGSGVESQQRRTAIVVCFFFLFCDWFALSLFLIAFGRICVWEKSFFFCYYYHSFVYCDADATAAEQTKAHEGLHRSETAFVGCCCFFFFFFPSFLPSFVSLTLSLFLSLSSGDCVCVCVCVCCYCGGRLVRHSGAPIVGWMSPFIGSNSRKKMIINPKFGPCYPLVTRRTPVFVVRVVPKFRAEFFFVGWVGFVFYVIDV